jgi:hypothetical protein
MRQALPAEAQQFPGFSLIASTFSRTSIFHRLFFHFRLILRNRRTYSLSITKDLELQIQHLLSGSRMRLLNTRTRQFREFHNRREVAYAILSHRWIEGEEVSYQDYLILTAGDDLIGVPTAVYRRSDLVGKRVSSGFRKIENACKRAATDGYDWIWIDTCCIDKSSSAELSEAINSMWKWYSWSEVCYAYLSDVECEDELASQASQKSFRESEWWARVRISFPENCI